jgi:predicted nucleic acid-binding protein
VLILGGAALFRFVLAEIVIEETERALRQQLGGKYSAKRTLSQDFSLLLRRLHVERVPHVSQVEFDGARTMIRHRNDIPVIAAAVKAKPDWLLTTNTSHFNATVEKKTGLQIATPTQLLARMGGLVEL